MTTEFWVQLVIYAVSFGVTFGTLTTKLHYIEKKVDSHNGFEQRVTLTEERVNKAHTRIDTVVIKADRLEDEVDNIKLNCAKRERNDHAQYDFTQSKLV